MRSHPFKGLSVAVVTPFNEDYSIDKTAFINHLNFLLDNGVNHLVVSGTTGESPTFNDEEFEWLIKSSVEVVKDAKKGSVIIGSGSNDTRKSIHRSQMANDLGADGLLLVSPYYNKPTQKMQIEHFSKIADHVDIPIMLYNVPGRTAVNILPETTQELSKHERIIAIKEASNDMQQILTVLEYVDDQFGVFAGDDAMTLPVIASGGMGLVSVMGNQVPKLTSEYVQFCLDHEFEEARAHHFQLQRLMQFNFVESNPAPVKAGLAMMGKMKDVVRGPLLPLSDEHRSKMKELLTNLGAL